MGRLICHWEEWCLNFVADFPGKGQPFSNCNSFLLTCTKGSALLCWHAGTDTVAESQMTDCVRKAFSVPLLGILWEGACIHTETHWNHRSFLQVQICFYLKQFSNHVLCEEHNLHISVAHLSTVPLRWTRREHNHIFIVCVSENILILCFTFLPYMVLM